MFFNIIIASVIATFLHQMSVLFIAINGNYPLAARVNGSKCKDLQSVVSNSVLIPRYRVFGLLLLINVLSHGVILGALSMADAFGPMATTGYIIMITGTAYRCIFYKKELYVEKFFSIANTHNVLGGTMVFLAAVIGFIGF